MLVPSRWLLSYGEKDSYGTSRALVYDSTRQNRLRDKWFISDSATLAHIEFCCAAYFCMIGDRFNISNILVCIFSNDRKALKAIPHKVSKSDKDMVK